MLKLTRTTRNNWDLAISLSKRAIRLKYSGSALGIWWCVLQPLAMLGIYTFVFSTIFRSRWPGIEEMGSLGYATNLFVGLVIFSFFADMAGTAPTSIIENQNFVKKVVFPLEILGVSQVMTCGVPLTIGALLMTTMSWMTTGRLHGSTIMLPVILLPLGFWALALFWLLSGVAVYIKDVHQVMPAFISMMMFMSAVFYPVEMIPEGFRWIMSMNPVAAVIDNARGALITGTLPSIGFLLKWLIGGIISSEIALRMFLRLKGGFADVI